MYDYSFHIMGTVKLSVPTPLAHTEWAELEGGAYYFNYFKGAFISKCNPIVFRHFSYPDVSSSYNL